MRSRFFLLFAVTMAAVSSAWAQTPPALTVATAVKMAAACTAYAEERRAAVNIWVFDGAGALVHFQRMDGAPPVGQPVDTRSGSAMIGGRFDDPNAFNASAPGAVPVMLKGQMIGTVRAAGMGAIGDRACARAAADAAIVPAGG
jgi:uncharacterized protein GlcG (DUF336 family)